MNKKLIFIPFLFGIMMSGCNGGNGDSNSQTSEELSSPTSFFEGYVDFEEALENTKYYVLNYNDTEEERPAIEVYLENMYYSSFSKVGYIELEQDKGYLHAFSTYYASGEIIRNVMEVYGRNTTADNLVTFESSNFKSLINMYRATFFKLDDNLYKSINSSFISETADFFQGKVYKYATEIRITIGQDGRLETFSLLEGEYPILSVRFDNLEYQDLDMYKLWIEAGSKIEERIYDYKTLIQSGEDFMSCYENEIVEFEATVVAKDCYGAIYVANRNDSVGHIGIKVNPTSDSDSINIKDIVKVKGTIKTENWNAYILNGKIEDTGKDNTHAPYFDEDALVDSLGGGVYAAQLFSSYPYFNDSLYSTYAFVYDKPTNVSQTQDTYIDLIFPLQTSGTNVYHMEIIIPASLSDAKKIELFNSLDAAGLFGLDNSYELNLERFIMKYDRTYQYKLRLFATEDSTISRRLNAVEKIEKNIGLTNFPIPEEKTAISYKFGGFTNLCLENDYGVEESNTEGIFLAIDSLTLEEIDAFYDSLINYGATKYDEVKDIYELRHIIYQIGNTNIDILVNESSSEEGVYTLNAWIYNGTLIQGKDIFERLDEKIGEWFDVDNFLKHTGTYDADYTIYALRTYAGKFYSEDNPLYCVTIDTKEMIFDDYNRALIEKGYKQYRVNNKPYTYISRGQTHYVFYLDDVYLDIATYHTSDYTYTGHKNYEYRLEILIYKGEPMSVETYDDLSELSNLYAEIDPSLDYNPILPSDAKVEIWRDLKDFTIVDVDYGYGSRDEAFVYTSDVEGAYEACKQALIDAGYEVSGTEWESSILFHKVINGTYYNVLLLKEPEKGYLRVFNDIGGVDFFR